VRRVNVHTAPLEPSGEGVRSADVAAALGSQQCGVRLLELGAGRGEGEYHLHHGIEEWLLVLAGAPVVRTPAGERTLRAGDVLCFPPGAAGAHRVTGPGRVLMLSDRAPLDAIGFPDSGAVYLDPPGVLLQGEAGAEAPAGAGREPLNLADHEPPAHDDAEQPAGYGRRVAWIGKTLGASRLGASLYEADPGMRVWPYHYEVAEEEAVLVLAGTPTLRDPDGEHELAPGDLAWFATGPEGAHQIVNRSSGVARFLMLSTVPDPDVSICVYPDSDKVGVWPWPAKRLRIGEGLPYWDGEG
jgi:uncharacterized cupin superfamily protein